MSENDLEKEVPMYQEAVARLKKLRDDLLKFYKGFAIDMTPLEKVVMHNIECTLLVLEPLTAAAAAHLEAQENGDQEG